MNCHAGNSGLEATRLGELLLRRGLVQRRHVERALRIQQATRQRLGEVLVGRGWLSEAGLVRTLRLQYRLRRSLGLVVLTSLPVLGWAGTAPTQDGAQRGAGGLVALEDQEMRGVSAASALPDPVETEPLLLDVAGSTAEQGSLERWRRPLEVELPQRPAAVQDGVWRGTGARTITVQIRTEQHF